MGGSPCQGFSRAGKTLNFSDPRSALFFEFVRVMKEVQPKYFLLENVRMKKEYQDIITEYLGVEPIAINSNLVSAQNRNRLYWTNIPNIEQPKDRNIVLLNILEKDISQTPGTKSLRVTEATKKGFTEIDPGECYDSTFPSSKTRRGRAMRTKCNCLTASNFEYHYWNGIDSRKITPLECERLQTVPDGYTEGASKTQRYRMLGNGWTVEVIKHIFKNIVE